MHGYNSKTGIYLSGVAWFVALVLLAYAGFLAWQKIVSPASHSAVPVNTASAGQKSQENNVNQPDPAITLPDLVSAQLPDALRRKPQPRTKIPDRPVTDIQAHTIDVGDSLFELASTFKVKPETLLWANYDLLNDNPDMISVGMELKVPVVDGVLHEWNEGDTLAAVAGRYEAKVEDILNWPGNKIDLAEPNIEPGTLVMVPGGHREFRQWIIPAIPRGNAGVSASVYGAGACTGSFEGAYGSGAFIWPAGNHYLSGNDYWSGHLGIDIAAGEGAPIYSADSGVVVFSGWATGGYGYMIMVDHGNGYQTLYGHLSNTAASCGRSVGQGSVIGYAGSTGNSTGSHLHFEVRYQGGFVNPWYVLPAP